MSTSVQLSAASALGSYIAGVSYDMLPANVIREAKLRIADVVGIGLSGSRTSARNIKDFCKISSKPGTATLWGGRAKALRTLRRPCQRDNDFPP